MVSKSVLFALTVVAMIAGGSSTTTGVNYCVGAMQKVNTVLSLQLNLGSLIGGVLNLVVSVVNAVLNILGSLLGGLLGGGQYIRGPEDLNQALGLTNVAMYVNDCALRKNLNALGIAYSKNYLSQCYIYFCRTALLNADVDISAYTWLQLDVNFDINVYLNALLAIKLQVSGLGLTALFVRIEILVNFILANIDNIVCDLIGDLVSLCWNLLIGYSKSCGYSYYQSSYTTVVTIYTSILTDYNCGSINTPYLTGGNYCSACITG